MPTTRPAFANLEPTDPPNCGTAAPPAPIEVAPAAAPTNRGQDKLPWRPEVWSWINRAVDAEVARIRVAARFLPAADPIGLGLTVPSDAPLFDEGGHLRIDEASVVPLLETWVELSLTHTQVAEEPELRTARTLAVRAANLLSQAQDLFIFQGDEAVHSPLLHHHHVKFRSGPAGYGLLPPDLPDHQIIRVHPIETYGEYQFRWGERTFEAVADGYARLQQNGHYGPYALVLHTIPFADTFAPLPTTLIMPADRIKPLVNDAFYGTGTLPELAGTDGPIYTGVLVSVGGNTMDLVTGEAPTTSFLHVDSEGEYRFQVTERFALRLKDPTSIIKFEFLTDSARPQRKKPAGRKSASSRRRSRTGEQEG